MNGSLWSGTANLRKGGEALMRNGKRWNRTGQSTLEYLLIAAVVIAAVAIAAGAIIRPAVDNTMNQSASAINNAAAQLNAKLQ